MKAKEYYSRYLIELKRVGLADAVKDMVCLLMREADWLAKTRYVRTAGGYAAIYKEQIQKYKAICRLSNGAFKPDGFLDLIGEINPKAKELIIKYCGRSV